MSFFKKSSDVKGKDTQPAVYREYVKFAVENTYFGVCIDKCFANYNKEITMAEKVCLAKCIDRASDYLIMEKDRLNSYIKKDTDPKTRR